jgi:hypothetical protein
MKSLVLTALGFALIAGLARHYHWHTESRLQILAFWGLALFYEVEVRAIGHTGPSFLSFAVNGCAATASIIAMKWFIEGLPPWMP